MARLIADGWVKRDGLEGIYPRNVAAPSFISAAEPLLTSYDSANVDTDKAIGNVAANTRRAQGFKIGANANIGQLRIWVKKVGRPEDSVWMRIETDSAGVPSGTSVGSTVSCAGYLLATSYAWRSFGYVSPPSLIAGVQYWLVVYRDGAVDAANYYVWGADASAPTYPDGQGAVYNGTTWTLEATDHAFEVYKDSSWGWPASYTELVAATTTPFVPVSLHLVMRFDCGVASPVPVMIEIEVATGVAGSEVLIGRITEALLAYQYIVGNSTGIKMSRSYPLSPILIPSGARIAARVRLSATDSSAHVKTACYLSGYDGGNVPVMYPVYLLRRHLSGVEGGVSKTAPMGAPVSLTPGSFPAYGSYVEVWAAAAQDCIIHGATRRSISTGSDYCLYLRFATGAAASEQPRAVLPFPELGLGGLPAVGTQLLRIPFVVRKGERLAIAATGTAVATAFEVLYEEL
jgi:hypothetical protein